MVHPVVLYKISESTSVNIHNNLFCHLGCRGRIWNVQFSIFRNDFPDETLLIKVNISAAFHNFSPDVLIYVDRIGLTSNYFNMVHPVLLCLLTEVDSDINGKVQD
jgi:hypothetical protein